MKSTINPFVGLKSFEDCDSHLFFGRDDQIKNVITNLKNTGFTTIIGSSGSGKSSLIKSGIIPSIERGALKGEGNGWKPEDQIQIGTSETNIGVERVRDPQRALFSATFRHCRVNVQEIFPKLTLGRNDEIGIFRTNRGRHLSFRNPSMSPVASDDTVRIE